MLTGKFRKIDTPFWIYDTYENLIMAEVPLSGNALNKAEMEYHGKF